MFTPCEHTAYTLGLDGSEITRDETEFLLAMLAYQKRFHRRYPTWREVLHVVRCLGYRKTAPPSSVELGTSHPGEPPCPYSRAS